MNEGFFIELLPKVKYVINEDRYKEQPLSIKNIAQQNFEFLLS